MNKTQIFPAAALISISALAIAGCSTPQTPAIPDVITVQTKEQNVISVNSS